MSGKQLLAVVIIALVDLVLVLLCVLAVAG